MMSASAALRVRTGTRRVRGCYHVTLLRSLSGGLERALNPI